LGTHKYTSSYYTYIHSTLAINTQTHGMSVAGKICIITGSAEGLGKEFAARLLQAGAFVTISDLREDTGQKIVKEFKSKFGEERVTFCICDVTNEDHLERLFTATEQFFSRPVDIFVNNAESYPRPDWKKCLEINLMAVISASQMALEHMKGRIGCKIVNIASVGGLTTCDNDPMISYFVAKHGVVALSRSLANVNGRTGVDVLCLCPNLANRDPVAILDQPTTKSSISKSISSLGVLNEKDVATGLMHLLGMRNGTVLVVSMDTPCYEYVDMDGPRMILCTVLARFLHKVFGLLTVTHKQFLLTIGIALIFLHLCIAFYLF